jgi:hypothetical protein
MSLTAGVTYTFSFYFKNGTVSNPYGQIPINFGITISTYTPTFQTIETALNTNIDVGNGWYRQVYTFTPSYTQTYQVNFNQANNQTPVGTYYLYGFQLEIGSSVTDYYATTSTAKNRGTIWSDLSGRGNTGTLTNSVRYNNSNIGSFVFDGVDDCITSFPTQISSTGSRTVSCFFKSNTTARIGLCGTRESGNTTGWVFTVNRNIAGNLTYFHTGGSTIEIAAGININTWYNGCVTYDASTATATLYLNGVQIGSPSTSFSAMTSSAFNGIIGAEQQSVLTPFTGNISQVSIYNRALTAAEVQQNFNALRGRFGI